MLYPLTDSQQHFVSGLKMQNTDDRAVRIIEDAFRVRNAWAPSGVENRDDAAGRMCDTIDEIA